MSLDPRLRLRHITCFLTIARLGSIAEAANQLSVTQPAVSKTLRELEEILGNRLFDREGRGLRINSAGRTFQQLAGLAVGELERAQHAVTGTLPEYSKLSIGVLPTAASDLAPRAALHFRETAPHCRLRVSTGPNWLLLSQLREGSLDLVIGRMGEEKLMRGLDFEQLYPEDVVAVVRPDHPLHNIDSAADLSRYPLILPPSGAVIYATVRGFLTSIGMNPVTPAFETVALAFARKVLEQSDCVWFISHGVVSLEIAEGSLRALSLNSPMTAGPVGISQRHDAAPSLERRAMVSSLRTIAAQRH